MAGRGAAAGGLDSGLFRSEPMVYVQLNVSHSAAEDTVRKLGAFGKLHVVDLNAGAETGEDKQAVALRRQMKRKALACVQWENKLAFFQERMAQYGIDIPHTFPMDRPAQDVLAAVAAYLSPLEEELHRNMEFEAKESRRVHSLVEQWAVLEVCKSLPSLRLQARGSRRGGGGGDDDWKLFEEVELLTPGAGGAGEEDVITNSIVGTIPQIQQGGFERMLFRVTRGNSLVRFHVLERPLVDPKSGDRMAKSVFYVVSIGRNMFNKVERMTSFFSATVYDVPLEPESVRQRLEELRVEIRELRHILAQNRAQIVRLLSGIAHRPGDGNSPIRDWQVALAKTKETFRTLTKARHYNTYLTIEGWLPADETKRLEGVLHEAVSASGEPPAALLVNPPHDGAPPTFFRTNQFTTAFQGIVDTYGVPRYQEVNPGLFTIITFPFLFGIMYGDVGHGLAMLAFALFLIFHRPAQARGEIFEMMHNGRFLLLLMGAFSVYSGLIYNDCLSVPINLFGGGQHPIFGLTGDWHGARNELTFLNSLKMKISVVVGVSQMMFGIWLSLFNHLHFQDRLSVVFLFVPQLIFFSATFGYMVLLILYKYTVDWSAVSAVPPNLIETCINMWLQPGVVNEPLYEGQAGVQVFLVLVAVLCVPVMLLGKPLYEHYALHRTHAAGYRRVSIDDGLEDEDEEDEAAAAGEAAEDDGHKLSEELIHSGIHTIEFVLGAVSNTASYLRLWALSLAHAELAQVFWEKLIVEYGLKQGGLMLVVSWAAWAGATFAVLLCMDVLECFLHALRLHWVEFQNKFYNADGFAFEPFRFDQKS